MPLSPAGVFRPRDKKHPLRISTRPPIPKRPLCVAPKRTDAPAPNYPATTRLDHTRPGGLSRSTSPESPYSKHRYVAVYIYIDSFKFSFNIKIPSKAPRVDAPHPRCYTTPDFS